MLTTTWNPFGQLGSEFNRLRKEMNQLFGDSSHRSPTQGRTPLNLWEDDNSYYVEVELPGFSQDNIELQLEHGNELTLKGERTRPEVEGGKWHRLERSFGGFTRRVQLPGEVEVDKVNASFKNGVLTVTLPKAVATQPRRIEVKS